MGGVLAASLTIVIQPALTRASSPVSASERASWQAAKLMESTHLAKSLVKGTWEHRVPQAQTVCFFPREDNSAGGVE